MTLYVGMAEPIVWYGYCFIYSKQFYEQFTLYNSRDPGHRMGLRIFCLRGRKYYSYLISTGSYSYFAASYRRQQKSYLSTLANSNFTCMNAGNLIEFLNKKVDEYNQPFFIASDPISIPHLFTRKQDIEIAGFFAAIFSWGNRTSIIKKTKQLMDRMDMSPYEFCCKAGANNLKRLRGFKHRTFNDDDLFYFIEFFHQHYKTSNSLETAFSKWMKQNDDNTERALNGFKKYFFSSPHLKRTEKHISSPLQKSTCKRLNMFLRWMVRKDKNGVDFGTWKKISPAQLVCPVDVHVARVARRLGLLKRKQTDWLAAVELTKNLRKLDKSDPGKYDFALFGLGALEKF